MSGLAGGLMGRGESFSDKGLLDRMGNILAHRGPDDCGTLMNGPFGVVHRRLSVIDLTTAGHQPMCNEDSTVWLAFDGEVYNFRDLRQRFRLDEKGHTFRSRTDTEVLIHLYETLGKDFLRLLNGMYSLALWDSCHHRLLLARDPFGIKPLFCTWKGDSLWFGSEIKALLEVPGVERTPSLEALYHYLSFGYVPDSLTPFEGIEELRPGHAMEISWETASVRTWRFFDMSYIEDESIGSSSAIVRTRELLGEAVRRQLVSDVPVGAVLSGGMDSSALTMLMASIRGSGNFHTFTLGFEEPGFDESGYAEIIAKKAGTRHHIIPVTPDRVAANMPGFLSHIDEPYADGSAIPEWLLAEEAGRHVTVLLSGEGSDEVFAGYDAYAACKSRNLYRRFVPSFVRNRIIHRFVHGLGDSGRKESFEFRLKRFIDGAELGVSDSHYSWWEVLSPDAKREILRDHDRFSGLGESSGFFDEVYSRCRAGSELNRLLCIDSCCHLPNSLLMRNDRMTMAFSIEARVPFTDTELFTFLAKIPVQHKFPRLRRKHLLRKAMAGSIPERIARKRKTGLEIPFSSWMRKRLREITLEYISPARLNQTGLFDPQVVSRLWDEHDRKKADHGRTLWVILNYMMWYDLYIDSTSYRTHVRPGITRNAVS